MILHVYAVKDLAVDAFMPPFVERSDGAALRAFSNAVMDVKHVFSRAPSDYVLFHIALFNDNSGHMEPVINGPVMIARALDIVQSKTDPLN